LPNLGREGVTQMIEPTLSKIKRSCAYREIIQEGERKKTLELAKNMLREGLDIRKVTKITKLPKREIEKLVTH
jgi:predicted transposase/invertase (TIGR01784 family)